jgi:nucleoid DNA-binding protein
MKRTLLRDEREQLWRDVLAKTPIKGGTRMGRNPATGEMIQITAKQGRTMSQFESFLERATGEDRKTIKLFFSGLETRIADATRGLITIPHWGSFGIKIKPRKGRMGRNPATGETIHIPGKQIAKGYLLFAISAKELRTPDPSDVPLLHPRSGCFQESFYGESAIEHQSYDWCSRVHVKKTNLKKLSLKRRLVVEICRGTGVDLRLGARLMDEFLCHLAKVIESNETFIWKRVGKFGSKQKYSNSLGTYRQSCFTVSAQMKVRLGLRDPVMAVPSPVAPATSAAKKETNHSGCTLVVAILGILLGLLLIFSELSSL